MKNNPNVVVILADDMGYGDLSCYGAQKYSTPNMDRVASDGMRFTNMHSSSAVCTPSRYSVLTGRYCWRTRLKSFVLGGFGSPLIEPERATIASMLKGRGYSTAAIGKWHLGLDWYDKDGRPMKNSDLDGWNIDGHEVDYARGFDGGPCSLGFDQWFGIAGSLDMPPYCFLENRGAAVLPDRPKDHYYPQQREGLMSPGWDDRTVDLEFTRRAVDFIEGAHKSSEPFFLYLTPSAPHRPCVPAEQFKGKSDAGNRGDMVLTVDHMVGEVLRALETTGARENTLLIVSSDNGARLVNYDGKDYGHKANGDLRGQKGDIYEGGHREPCVVMWPEVIPRGSTSDELLSLADIFATLAEIVGESLSENEAEDSISFLRILQGETGSDPIHEAVIHHALDGMFSVRSGDWKCVFGTGSGGFSEPARYAPVEGAPAGQLYNVSDDYRETNNLWDKYPEIVTRLQRILTRYQEEGRSRPIMTT